MTDMTTQSLTMAASVASEDLKRGEFVAVLNDIVELPAFDYCDRPSADPQNTIRVRYCGLDAGTPMKIKAICLPFVFVMRADEAPATLDVRQVQLVRLNRMYAKKVWKILKQETRKQQRAR